MNEHPIKPGDKVKIKTPKTPYLDGRTGVIVEVASSRPRAGMAVVDVAFPSGRIKPHWFEASELEVIKE